MKKDKQENKEIKNNDLDSAQGGAYFDKPRNPGQYIPNVDYPIDSGRRGNIGDTENDNNDKKPIVNGASLRY